MFRAPAPPLRIATRSLRIKLDTSATMMMKNLSAPSSVSAKTDLLIGSQARQAATFRIAIYCFFIVLVVVIGIKEASKEEPLNYIAKAADVIGLLAFGILGLQFVLSARLPWIERPFGLDRVMRFHRSMGITVGTLLVTHPVLMALSGEPELLTKLPVPLPVQFGRVAVILLLATVTVSLRRTALRIPYERWRFWHNVAAVVILLLAFVHSFFVKGGIHTPLGRVFWGLLVVMGLTAWGYRHFHQWHQHHMGRYVISQVIHEANNTWSLVLKPEDGGAIPRHFPGQFAFIRVLGEGPGAGEEHPFTIASAPDHDHLIFTIRASGDFTRRIHELERGTRVAVNGPFGRFSAGLYPEENELVFIAGGVGITPFLSMVRSMRRTGSWRPVTLLHACRTESDLLLREELAEIERSGRGRFKFVQVLSAPGPCWQGTCGHIDREFIHQHTRDRLDEKGFYVCGPPGMMVTVERHLKEIGVASRRVHAERFSL